MDFIYTTDLHGDIPKYEAVLGFALEHDIKLMHLGADLLPKGNSILKMQKLFVNGYLKTFYSRCSKNNIKVLAFFGNDDIFTRKQYFRKYGELLDEVCYRDGGILFSAYGFVPDYPFGLKTACKLDYKGWERPSYYLRNWMNELEYQTPIEYNEEGRYLIDDIEKYFTDKGTIEEDLKSLKGDVVAIHCPPCGCDLDVIMSGQRVGSKSVRNWIEKKQPKLVLCGHIHENLSKTGFWKADIGKTLVIQPGQGERTTHLVYIEIADSIRANLVQV